MKIIKKNISIVSVLVLGLATVTNVAFAAGTDVQFTADTNILLTGPGLTITIASGSKVASYSVSATTLTMNVDTGSTITVKSSGLYSLNSNLLQTFCSLDKTYTYVTQTTVTSPTAITIAPTNATAFSCTTTTTVVSSGGGGGGGGRPSSSPTVTPVSVSTDTSSGGSVATAIAKSQKFVLGQKSSATVLLQNFLKNDLGIFKGTSSGYFGKATVKAIQQFQIKYKIVKKHATSKTAGFGTLGPKTRAKMNEVYQSMHPGQASLFQL